MNYNYKIVNIMDEGTSATLYKIKFGLFYYVLRREKILDSDAKFISNNDENSQYIEKINFNKFINKLNKNHFTILYKYKLESNSKYKSFLHNFVKNDPIKLKDYYLKEKSKYCLDMIIDLKDGILYDILYKISNIQVYSMIIQCVYALNLMHENGYYHNDVCLFNIMYKKTKIKTLKILNLNVPTFGSRQRLQQAKPLSQPCALYNSVCIAYTII